MWNERGAWGASNDQPPRQRINGVAPNHLAPFGWRRNAASASPSSLACRLAVPAARADLLRCRSSMIATASHFLPKTCQQKPRIRGSRSWGGIVATP